MKTGVGERQKFEDNPQFDRKPVQVPSDGEALNDFSDLDTAPTTTPCACIGGTFYDTSTQKSKC